MATPGNKLTRDAAYKVNIPLYEGPLDLLLDLIKKQEMNIHDIQISLITAQYLEYLHKLEELNVDVSADFIYMAATLIYIKSKMLLPPDPLAAEEGVETDPRAELVQRLVEHEKFKNAAQLLYQKQQIEENVWSKPDKSLYNDEGTEGELVVSLVDLVKVFQQVLERRKEVSRIELQHEQFTVAQMIAALRAQILASADSVVNLIQESTGAFLGAQPAEEKIARDRIISFHPAADGVRRPHNHVHALGIPGPEAEVNQYLTPRLVALESRELAVTGGARHHLHQILQPRFDPSGKGRCSRDVAEEERGRRLILIRQHRGLDSAGLRQRNHPALVTANQRSLGSGHGHIKNSARVLAMNQHGTGDTQRYLRNTDRVFDVAPH